MLGLIGFVVGIDLWSYYPFLGTKEQYWENQYYLSELAKHPE